MKLAEALEKCLRVSPPTFTKAGDERPNKLRTAVCCQLLGEFADLCGPFTEVLRTLRDELVRVCVGVCVWGGGRGSLRRKAGRRDALWCPQNWFPPALVPLFDLVSSEIFLFLTGYRILGGLLYCLTFSSLPTLMRTAQVVVQRVLRVGAGHAAV